MQPFPRARDSILLLFNPLLEPERQDISHNHYLPVMSSFVKAHGMLFRQGSITNFIAYGDEFLSLLDNHIGRVEAKYREQGVCIGSANIAGMFEYGNSNGILMKLYTESLTLSPEARLQAAQEYWANPPTDVEHSLQYSYIGGDKNVLPHVHLSLAFIWSLALVPASMVYVQGEIPWGQLVVFLNTVYRHGVDESRVENEQFPIPESGTAHHLPEDFFIRGQVWAQLCYPADFFDDLSVNDEERSLELPSVAVPRTERCLWYGYRLASLDRWITFNKQDRQFRVKPFATELEKSAQVFGRRQRPVVERVDAE
ncbi:hypothetical protein ACJ73_06946 [Blastomyces percursus]|uniref:Uncharacterized protein n=1 Tax=Blastomyces percursus TaxID=1658174 RepID=A0A1J9PZF7_9EURO|nr:hypothetical protein ACJ73_06946 [Blastomyces percursus]